MITGRLFEGEWIFGPNCSGVYAWEFDLRKHLFVLGAQTIMKMIFVSDKMTFEVYEQKISVFCLPTKVMIVCYLAPALRGNSENKIRDHGGYCINYSSVVHVEQGCLTCPTL
ncbi:hypothetical protein CEXT_93381 [Caerostris extrusa]|uniref:Uncharacterized protein n=1 Tax=Caerostris extrusa TaxID=172846 RepID=A0AAV4VM19_CAEEX|nr:hypothetical protein CEXT_93381 [Caerostris extrusa]